MDYTFDFEREDFIDINEITSKIEIWRVSALMDGGTLILHCRYKDVLFHIISKQHTIKNNYNENREFLRINNTSVKPKSDEEKKLIYLIKHSINSADNLWYLPKFIRPLVWSKSKSAYWIYILKKEILNFYNSKEYLEFTK